MKVSTRKPNILLILNDDMGYSDLGCYGGEVQTPNLDGLAKNGLRFTQFYNTARCCPSRASLLTGLHPHQADVGHMVSDDGIDGYLGNLSFKAVTIAEVLKQDGYRCYMSGKWHITRPNKENENNWPRQRGFDRFHGIVIGASNYFHVSALMTDNEKSPVKDPNYYFTDDITHHCVQYLEDHFSQHKDTPFFTYLAYTAPHWPLHAPEKEIAKYKGRFTEGWDELRKNRMERMIDAGIINKEWRLTDRDPEVVPWADAGDKAWEERRMEVYAAQIDRMDQGIGRVLETLEKNGQLENTLIFFLADNGGCAEEMKMGAGEWRKNDLLTHDGRMAQYGNDPKVMPGSDDTYQSYGRAWANLSNTPFREYKHWVHEGGIATPFIVHWPKQIKARGELRHQPHQLPDVMATILEAAGAIYPQKYQDRSIMPCEGFSMLPVFENKKSKREVLYWEHEGNKAVRKGEWKLVCKHGQRWELYNVLEDRTEVNDLAEKFPEVVKEMNQLYEAWAKRCKVLPYEKLVDLREARKNKRAAVQNKA